MGRFQQLIVAESVPFVYFVLYFIYQFMHHNFLCLVMDAVHAAYPFHLTCRFQGFCDTFLLWKFNVRDEVIALPAVCTAHFFKDRFHSALFCVFRFQPLLRYFDFFPITAVPFTTNDLQSYVLDSRNHPLHISPWLLMELLSPCCKSSLERLG